MKSAESKDVLRERLGRPPEELTAREGIAAMMAFYAEERGEAIEIDEDGDMLLYQWGVTNLVGPECFLLDITRQFCEPGEDEPFQLSLSFHYAPTAELQNIENGNQWCHAPENLDEFKAFVDSSVAFGALADEKPALVELHFEQC